MLSVLRHYPKLMPDWTAHSKAHLPVDYWLSVALFDFAMGERLAVSLPGGQTDTRVGLWGRFRFHRF